jgi:proteic killer suppression protein
VILSFADAGTADVFNVRPTKAARRVCPENLWKVARRKLTLLNVATRIDGLRSPPGNQLELLKGDRAGQYSIRINNKYRVCFRWTDFGAEAVEIVDYH